MPPPATTERYKHHRFPGEMIRHGIRLYSRFLLGYHDGQELLCERGIDVTHDAIRQWCFKLGQDDAHALRRRRPRSRDTWHPDERLCLNNLTKPARRHRNPTGTVSDNGQSAKIQAREFLDCYNRQ
jgi:putative transposase